MRNKYMRLVCSKCGIPCKNAPQLDKHMSMRHVEEPMDPETSKGLIAPLTMTALEEEMIKYGTLTRPHTTIRTEAERIELLSYFIDQNLDLMKGPLGPSPSGVKVLLDLVQSREIMLANKEEIDGSR